MDYSAVATTSSGSGWLTVSPNQGTVKRPFLDVSFVNVNVSSTGLAPGDYYGQITVTATGASNSPQTILVVMNVLSPGSDPGPEVRPTGLVFTAVENGDNPSSQNVTVANITSTPLDFGTSVGYVAPGNWIKSLPANGTIQPNSPTQIAVQPDFTGLSAAIRRGGISIIAGDGSIRTVSILSVVAPNQSAGSQTSETMRGAQKDSAGCTPTALYPQFTQLGSGTSAPAGWPLSILVKVVDDCGSPFTSGSVSASFSNGDAPLSLLSLQDGNWSATWQPLVSGTAGVTVTVTAYQPASGLKGSLSATTTVQGVKTLPVLLEGPINAVTLTNGPIAPGELVLIKGTSLANSQAAQATTPQQTLGGASVLVGGKTSSLLYADNSQIVALIPNDTAVNTPQQVVVVHDVNTGIPKPVVVAGAQPAVFTKDGSGQGQGLAYKMSGAKASVLADSSNPISPGDSILIFCAGLGSVDAGGVAVNAPSVAIGGVTTAISYAGLAIPNSFPPAGAPSILGGIVSTSGGGLYQIVATVPAGVPGGTVALTITAAGQISPAGLTLSVVGGQTSSGPSIASVNTAGGYLGFAQNTFIEIKGSNLAPANVGAGLTWDNAPEFLSGRMPTQLSGVSVTVNGKAAFVYFVSPGQLNVLTPLDNTIGPVQIVVSNGGQSSSPFTVTASTVAPSFLRFGATQYVVATHVNNSLIGPATLSSGSYQFTPAHLGETITLYAVGFGLPSTVLINGSSSQSGSLPTNPQIQIGGGQANVSFAGLIGPGLYQINVVIPATIAVGDVPIVATYNGLSSPSADLLTIQP
jgi:uncharacterized protein (TIGR03437 family)